MRKKLVCILIILILVLFTAMPAFAYPANGSQAPGSMADSPNLRENIQNEGIIGDAVYIEKDGENEKGEIDPLEKVLQEIISNKDIKETEQFLVTLTKPASNQNVVFKKLNIICGVAKNEIISEEEVIIVILARYNEKTGLYEEFKNTEGKSRWNIGVFGLFTKEIELFEGINKLKVIAFKTPAKIVKLLNLNIDENGETNPEAETGTKDKIQVGTEKEMKAEDIKLEAGKNLQISFLTINVQNETIKDKIINTMVKISDVFNNIFPK
ncbi:MAG: hypothetical protein HPY74_08910 [Firmicutes bacterium]|nr:hypothetical protein [Bacillota bacterium]